MKKRNLFAHSLLFTMGAFVCTKILFAGDAPPPPPPVAPPPPPIHGAPAAGAPATCPDTLSKAKLGKLLRNGIKAGVIKQEEGFAEDDVLTAMMTNKAPVKSESTTPGKAKSKLPQGANPNMVEEMRKAQEARKLRASTGSMPEVKKQPADASQEPAPMKRNLRSSASGRLENKPSMQPDSAQDQPQKPEPAWMTKLKQRQAAAAKSAQD